MAWRPVGALTLLDQRVEPLRLYFRVCFSDSEEELTKCWEGEPLPRRRRASSFSYRTWEDEVAFSSAPSSQPEAAPAPAAVAPVAPVEEDRTHTLVMRNLPSWVTQKAVLRQLKEAGFAEDVCALYMPTDFSKRGRPASKGIAFVCLETSATARQLADTMNKTYAFGQEQGVQRLDITRADTQGLDALKKKWANSKTRHIRNEQYRPYLKS